MQSEGLIELKCPTSGAPLSAREGQEIVECRWCGGSHRVTDARQFLDQLRVEVSAWLRTAIPTGTSALSASADPIARHNIFEMSVRPSLQSKLFHCRSNLSMTLSQSLLTLPYVRDVSHGFLVDPKEMFRLQAELQSVEPLAVSPANQKLVKEAEAMAQVYAYILNDVDLMKGDKRERHHLMAESFEAAATSLEGYALYAGLPERIRAAGFASRACDDFLNERVDAARDELQQALQSLEAAETAALGDASSGIMLQGIEAERKATRAVGHLLSAFDGVGPAQGGGTLDLTYRVFSWSNSFPTITSNPDRLEAVAEGIALVRRAATGQGTILIGPGSGDLLLPFWMMELRYSFQTGALWAKKGREVGDYLLVAASAVLPARGGPDSTAVTDIFGLRGKGGIFDSVRGKEASISAGSELGRFVNAAIAGGPGTRKVVPSVSVGADAVLATSDYIELARRSDPKVDKQLRLSSPRAMGLVFLPANLEGASLQVSTLGRFTPRNLVDPRLLQAIAS